MFVDLYVCNKLHNTSRIPNTCELEVALATHVPTARPRPLDRRRRCGVWFTQHSPQTRAPPTTCRESQRRNNLPSARKLWMQHNNLLLPGQISWDVWSGASFWQICNNMYCNIGMVFVLLVSVTCLNVEPRKVYHIGILGTNDKHWLVIPTHRVKRKKNLGAIQQTWLFLLVFANNSFETIVFF